MFEHGQVRDGIQVANTLVVPALAQLSREGGAGEGDGEVLERVREEWCQCLGRPDLNEGRCEGWREGGAGEVLERVREEWCQCLGRPDLNEGRCEGGRGWSLLCTMYWDHGHGGGLPVL